MVAERAAGDAVDMSTAPDTKRDRSFSVDIPISNNNPVRITFPDRNLTQEQYWQIVTTLQAMAPALVEGHRKVWQVLGTAPVPVVTCIPCGHVRDRDFGGACPRCGDGVVGMIRVVRCVCGHLQDDHKQLGTGICILCGKCSKFVENVGVPE